MSTNGSRPRPIGRRMPGSRRTRLAVGAATALVIGAVLVAPVVLLGTGPKHNAPCSTTILYQGQRYVGRSGGRVVEAIAVGVGVASGCGAKPTNVDLRSVQGVSTGRAVALASEPATVYVRQGLCAGKTRIALLACLRA